MSKEPNKFARRYDEDFKRQMVEWIDTQQRSKRELSRELGVSEWSLSRWGKQYGKEAAAGG
jgi:transposase-like protein